MSSYSIQTAFPNHNVSLDRLKQEIEQSAITTALADISTSGDTCAVTFKADLSPGEQLLLDDIVAAHSGLPLPDNARQSVTLQPFAKPGRNFIVTGRRFEITLGQATNCDTVFLEEREIQGARLCVADAADGDYVDFVVVHPLAGVVLQWAETIYVKPGGGVAEYITGSAKALPPGLILRMIYHSVGTTVAPVAYVDFLGWR